ncbi:hypothetical protein ACN268_26845 [Micromonospora sp. WMMD735]|uniref:hypothetical protein n=1 Tax=Micromonospora sp. WMMD735 TaxID=3404130 RepID=UPI003B95555D
MLTYYVLFRSAETADPVGIFVVDAVTGHALLWDHRRRSWTYNPDLVARFLDDHRNFGRYREVDRSVADRAAVDVSGGQTLPDVDAIERIFAQAAVGDAD